MTKSGGEHDGLPAIRASVYNDEEYAEEIERKRRLEGQRKPRWLAQDDEPEEDEEAAGQQPTREAPRELNS